MKADIEVISAGLFDKFVPRTAAGFDALERVFSPAPEGYRQAVEESGYEVEGGPMEFFAGSAAKVEALREEGVSVEWRESLDAPGLGGGLAGILGGHTGDENCPICNSEDEDERS